VLVVSKENPVEGLSYAEVKGIYSGAIDKMIPSGLSCGYLSQVTAYEKKDLPSLRLCEMIY